MQKSTSTLVDLDYNVVELPNYLLPQDTKPGSVIKITFQRDEEEEAKRDKEVDRICQKVTKGLQSNNMGAGSKVLQMDD